MTNNKMFDDGCELDFGIKDTLEVYCENNVQKIYRIFLDEEITEPSKYRNVVNTLERATENDVVEFRINTIGGNLFSTLPIYNGILSASARTRAIIDGTAISAGTLIPLACDDVIVMKNSLMMCHSATWGAWGDLKSLRDQSNFKFQWARKLIGEVYEGFMSEEEIEDMVENSMEYWMFDDEIVERLQRRQEYMQKQESQKIVVPEKQLSTRQRKKSA